MGAYQTVKKIEVLIKSAIIGAAVSVISLPLEHPLDALKTNMQANQTGMRAEAQAMLARKGWRAFYNGFSINLLRVMVKQAYRWPMWISIQTFYKQFLPNTNQVLRQSITGFSITLCELVIISPFQRIKVWLITTKSQDQAKLKNYYKLRNNLGHLYTGFLSLLIRQGLSWSSFLACTQITKNAIRKYKGSAKLSSTDLFLGSFPVAIVNTLFIMPIDCVKTFYQQYQEAQQKKPFIQTVRNIYTKYGLKGMYLGWNVRMIQYMINSAFTLIAIEDLLQQYTNS